MPWYAQHAEWMISPVKYVRAEHRWNVLLHAPASRGYYFIADCGSRRYFIALRDCAHNFARGFAHETALTALLRFYSGGFFCVIIVHLRHSFFPASSLCVRAFRPLPSICRNTRTLRGPFPPPRHLTNSQGLPTPGPTTP